MESEKPIKSDFYVYLHKRNDTGEVFYVGKGRGKRAFSGNKYHRNKRWLDICREAGGFSVNFVATDLSEDDAFRLEVDTIAAMRGDGVNLCNITAGGGGISGVERTPEWRAKIGAAHRGKVVSPETRLKLSIAVKASGYVPSEDARRKMSEAHMGHRRSLGYRHTEEWKAAASIRSKGNKSRLGQKRGAEERRKVSEAMAGRPQGKLVCPHCFKIGGNAMRRWHFENCRDSANAHKCA